MGLPSMAASPGERCLLVYGHTGVLQPKVVAARMMVPRLTPAKVTPIPAEMAITSSGSTETATQGV